MSISMAESTGTDRVARRRAPGLRQWLPFSYGFVRRAIRQPLRFYMENFERFGDVFRFQVGPMVFHQYAHPDAVKHVLQDASRNYVRGWQYKTVGLVLGNGLVISDGEFWRRQRRLAQPAFHRQRIAALAGTMIDATARMIESWRPLAKEGRPFDVAAEMGRLTLAIAARTLFSTDVSGAAEAIGQGLTVAQTYIDHRLNYPLSLPLFVPTPRNLRFKRARRKLDQVVYGIIEQRRKAPLHHKECAGNEGDLLSMLLAARDEETGEGMTDRQLRDEVMTFLMAGHETTAVALSWTWYLLSKHPDVARRLRAELEQVLAGRTPRYEDLPNLRYTRMVIEESMRLYPPVWGAMRTALAEDEIGGYHVPAKSTVVLTQWVTHRHPAFWENPEGFDPERFTPENAAKRPRHAYFPFLAGPHQCIGNDFALMEATLVLAMIAQCFCVELLPGRPVEPKPLLTLRPAGGVWVRLREAGEPNVTHG